MDIHAFIDAATDNELQDEICRLVSDSSPESLRTLKDFLHYHGRHEIKDGGASTSSWKITVPYLPILALLQKGPMGVRSLVRSLVDQQVLAPEAFGALWWAARGRVPPTPSPLDILSNFRPRDELVQPLRVETIKAARDGLTEILVEARTNPRLFWNVLTFISTSYPARVFFGQEGVDLDDFYEMMTSGAIKLSRLLLEQFESMIRQDLREEEYQLFLEKHPVFLDALAATVIPRQKLGIEKVTDFVLQRYDTKYILVEIEKPQDRLFTQGNDFTSEFTHAFGQVLDFQQWVDSNGAYATKHMPGISSPRGLLVMGRRVDLTPENKEKLHRFSVNCSTIDVVTFDDLLQNATNLYHAILLKGQPADC